MWRELQCVECTSTSEKEGNPSYCELEIYVNDYEQNNFKMPFTRDISGIKLEENRLSYFLKTLQPP